MFNCDSCNNQASRLRWVGSGKFFCYACVDKPKSSFNPNLGQTYVTYTRRDGSKGRITTSKKWEIENRITNREGIVVNRKTGKESQY